MLSLPPTPRPNANLDLDSSPPFKPTYRPTEDALNLPPTLQTLKDIFAIQNISSTQINGARNLEANVARA